MPLANIAAINSMGLTVWCIFISISALFFFGLPLSAWLFSSNKISVTEQSWLSAPLLGLCGTALFLQNSYYLGLPVKQSCLILLIIGVICWIAMLRKLTLTQIFSEFPRKVLIVALVIYFIQAFGLVLSGAENYVGRGWIDQYNYTVAAQYLINHAYHNLPDNAVYYPYLLKASMVLSSDRIGAMLIQSFLACISMTDAKTMFETTILLSPFLIVFVINQLGRSLHLSENMSLLAAALAGVMPSLAMIHLENFLSQALATPLFMFWPLAIKFAIEERSFKKIFFAAIILAGIISIYTEYLMMSIGLLIFFGLAATVLQKDFRIQFISRLLTTIISIVLFALLLNIKFIPGIFYIVQRTMEAKVLSVIYPWTNSIEALNRLWYGDFSTMLHGISGWICGVITIFLVLFGYAGYFFQIIRKKNILASVLLLILFLPLVIHAMGANKYPYQFYKLLLSVSALFSLGLILFFNEFFQKKISIICCILLFSISASATFSMVYASTSIPKLVALNRGCAQLLLSDDAREIQKRLSSCHDKQILINWQDSTFHGAYMNGWLNYFARKNKVWVTNPIFSDNDIGTKFTLPPFDFPGNDLTIITYKTSAPLVIGNSVHLIWSNHTFSEWKVDGTDWAILYLPYDHYFPLILKNQLVGSSKEITLQVLSGRKGTLKIISQNGTQVFSVEKGSNTILYQTINNEPAKINKLIFTK